MKVFVVFCITLISVLTGSINYRSNIVWSAERNSVSARISAVASVSNPMGTFWTSRGLSDKETAPFAPQLILRLPRASAAQVVLRTESETIRYSLSPYQTNASDVRLTGSAWLLPIEAWSYQFSQACEVCTLSVFFPHD